MRDEEKRDMVWYDVCIQILMYKIRYCLRLFFFFISIPPFIVTKRKKGKKGKRKL